MPHHWYLKAQPPDLERLKQAGQFHRGRVHLTLVIPKPIRLIIGNRVAVFAHIGQHAQQPLALRGSAFAERAVFGRQEQPDKQAAVLFNKAMTETARGQCA